MHSTTYCYLCLSCQNILSFCSFSPHCLTCTSKSNQHPRIKPLLSNTNFRGLIDNLSTEHSFWKLMTHECNSWLPPRVAQSIHLLSLCHSFDEIINLSKGDFRLIDGSALLRLGYKLRAVLIFQLSVGDLASSLSSVALLICTFLTFRPILHCRRFI